jgi:hypothetical protein
MVLPQFSDGRPVSSWEVQADGFPLQHVKGQV